MIVARDGDRLRAVTQPDHARLAGELLGLWRADGLPDHPRRHDLLFAVREHDNGWREADAAPRVGPDGAPLDFRGWPDGERREIWRRGVERFARSRPYAAALIAQHALALHGERAVEPGWSSWLESLGERHEELVTASGRSAAALAADYRWLELADLLSLAACGGLAGRRVALHGHEATVDVAEVATLRLRPFPLAGATTFALPCRWIEPRRFSGDAELGGALAAAAWSRLALRVDRWRA